MLEDSEKGEDMSLFIRTEFGIPPSEVCSPTPLLKLTRSNCDMNVQHLKDIKLSYSVTKSFHYSP